MHTFRLSSFILLTAIFLGCSHAPKILNAPEDHATAIELTGINPLGKSLSGQTINMGGFSGLYLVRKNETLSEFELITLTDRGPNSDYLETSKLKCRPFLLPKFQPRIVHIILNTSKLTADVVAETKLWASEKRPMSGLSVKKEDEIPCDIKGRVLPLDSFGADTEAISLDKDGNYWIGEEYGPSIFKFNNKGLLLTTLSPNKGVPAHFSMRKPNGGFEGLAIQNNDVFAILQTPFEKGQTLIRLVRIDSKTLQTTAEYIYFAESEKSAKIGDLYSLRDNKFIVLEQDGDTSEQSFKRVFEIDLAEATNVLGKEINNNWNLKDFEAQGFKSIAKKEIADLSQLGLAGFRKLEGLTALSSNLLALVNDNDFGLDGTVDPKTGFAPVKAEKSYLFLVPTKKSLSNF